MTTLSTVTALLVALQVSHADPTPEESPDEAVPADAFRCRAVQPRDGHRLIAQRHPETGACTGFQVLDAAGRTVLEHQDAFYGSGTIVPSRDLEDIVFVGDHPYAKLRPDGTYEGRARKGKDAPQKVEALVFFHQGKRVASHTLEDVLARPRLVGVSGGHVRWLAGDTSFLAEPAGDELTLTTTSFRQVTFDISSGTIVRAVDTRPWKSCDLIAFGRVAAFRGKIPYMMRPAHAVKGEVPYVLKFQAGPLSFQVGYNTLCFRRAEDGTVEATEVLPLLNGVTVR